MQALEGCAAGVSMHGTGHEGSEGGLALPGSLQVALPLEAGSVSACACIASTGGCALLLALVCSYANTSYQVQVLSGVACTAHTSPI